MKKSKKASPEGVDMGLRLLLRSVYLKGHEDGNLKTGDLSWEDKIVDKEVCDKKCK
jgi:hypothetical protein